jgi:hypothetical protein
MKYLLLALSLTFGTTLACLAEEKKAPDVTPAPIPAPHIGQSAPQVPQAPEVQQDQSKEDKPPTEELPKPAK